MNGAMKPVWQVSEIRTAILCLAALVHGLFSSPAPADPGLAEAAIALCLLIAMTGQLLNFLNADALFTSPRQLSWLWLCLIPLSIGIITGNNIRDWSRDLAAIIFLGLPVLVGALPRRDIQKFALAIAAAGSALALRYWIVTGATPITLNNLKNGDGLLYLSLDPSMLFAAVYLPIQFIEIQGATLRAWLLRGAALAGAFLCWGALGGMEMRGALGLGAAALVVFALTQHKRPIIPIMMAVTALLIALLFSESLMRMVDALWLKQQQVGLNARDDDLRVIWRLQAADPFYLLFGRGWGATYSSPAVGGYWVNYSHSALGFFLLKTGLCGLAAIAAYILSITSGVRQIWRQHVGLILAISAPLLLSFTLYTSYKFFSCGMLLLLLGSLDANPDTEPC